LLRVMETRVGTDGDEWRDMARFRDATEGQQLPGCIKVHNSAPGSLLKHARTHGFCLKASSKESICDEPCDEGVTRDWVHAHILQDLQPFPPLTVLGHGDSTKSTCQGLG
jgi:hypothetical protein